MLDIKSRQHHAITDLNEVHARLFSKINLQLGLENDNSRALTMERYLRALKKVNSQNSEIMKNVIESSLDDLAYEDLVELSKNALNIINANGRNFTSTDALFNREHRSFSQKGREADDIFEEELFAVLQAVQQKATGTLNYDLGLSLTGGQMTNIKKFATMPDDLVKSALEDIFNDLVNNQHWTKKAANAEVARIKAVSGKVDLQGFKATIGFEGELDPKWKNMLKAFSGASFTLKNYSSRTEILELHLGKSSPYRAISGALDDLGFSTQESDHIYYHARASYKKNHNEILARHIYHTRLYYELTGVGLYDINGDPISGANFIIYNDPFTDDIFVRSTKQILYDLVFGDQGQFSGDPWRAVTLKKTYFI